MTQQNNARKVGEMRSETISVTLTDEEVEAQLKRSHELRNQQDALAAERSNAMAEFTARKKRLAAAELDARHQVSTRKRDIEVIVQDYLTPGNEVVTVRCDETSAIIARRTATAAELQDEMLRDDDFGGSVS